MSVTNPERIVTKQDLADFYEGIFPYLGGNVEAGFTPIGTIIAVMGKTAPTNYLACNGQIVNIADYPELANYFKAQFGSYNYFGGNGTTTFAICDLRGEFLRGTGTNSHANNGNGAAVGTHQDATRTPLLYRNNSTMGFYDGFDTSTSFHTLSNNEDTKPRGSVQLVTISATKGAVQDDYTSVVSRPTNTSVLYCIATKNIYMNPALDYTEEEKVVGQWIDGSSLYQKTINIGTLGNSGSKTVYTSPVDIQIISYSGFAFDSSSKSSIPLPHTEGDGQVSYYYHGSSKMIRQAKSDNSWSGLTGYLTIQYTKI